MRTIDTEIDLEGKYLFSTQHC